MTPDAAVQSGTPLSVMHFKVGDWMSRAEQSPIALKVWCDVRVSKGVPHLMVQQNGTDFSVVSA